MAQTRLKRRMSKATWEPKTPEYKKDLLENVKNKAKMLELRTKMLKVWERTSLEIVQKTKDEISTSVDMSLIEHHEPTIRGTFSLTRLYFW
jgi:hypothetical protein